MNGLELNVLQVSRALGVAYSAIYRTIRFHAFRFIPVRKFRGRLLIPADALPLLLKLHIQRKHQKVPKGWVKVSEFSRRYSVSSPSVIKWARRLGILGKFNSQCYYIHEDSTEEIRLLLSICKTGQPPKDEFVRLTDAIKNRKLRARILSLLYLVQPLRIGKSVYLRRNDLEFLRKEAEVMKRGGNYSVSTQRD